jgi:hypothetical protein
VETDTCNGDILREIVMLREVRGLYSTILFGDFPEYTVVELSDLTVSAKYSYCVLYKLDGRLSASTNFFAEFINQLSEQDIKDCVLLPGINIIEEHLKNERREKDGDKKRRTDSVEEA